MKLEALSSSFSVRRLHAEDVESIHSLCAAHDIFSHCSSSSSMRNRILEDLRALPPGKDFRDKYYVGFWRDRSLMAVMDLILGYPDEFTAFIGLFVVNAAHQGHGMGSGIITECLSCLRHSGFKSVRLGVDPDNARGLAFWAKNGFIFLGKRGNYFLMEHSL